MNNNRKISALDNSWFIDDPDYIDRYVEYYKKEGLIKPSFFEKIKIFFRIS